MSQPPVESGTTCQSPRPRLFLGNFDFEHELAKPPVQRAPAVTRIIAEMASVWVSIAREGDCLWMPGRPEARFSEELADAGFPSIRWVSTDRELREILKSETLDFTPWGWSREVCDWADRRNLKSESPPLEAVRIANSRRFSFELETELGLILPGSAECHSTEAVENSLAQFHKNEAWVIKSEFGMSARERILGRGPKPNPTQIAWIQTRCDRGEIVFLEPWVSAVAEAGLQFCVPRDPQADPKLLGITPLLTDESGVYRGSRFDAASECVDDWSEAVRVARIPAKRAQEIGYFGPLGIDAMWYRGEKGDVKLRPIQDINARWTMGRLSLGFRDRLETDECGLWRHVRCPVKTPAEARTWWQHFGNFLSPGVRWIRTSPITTGGGVTGHATGLILAKDPELLHAVSQRLG